MMNIGLDKVQLVLFSPGISIPDKLKVATSIKDILASLFESDPIILPIPEDAPAEIPQIQLTSKDKKHSLSLAKSRLDLNFKYTQEDNIKSLPIGNVFEKFIDIFQYLTSNIYSVFNRTAIVTTWIAGLKEKPSAELILSKYIRDEIPINEPFALELSFLNKESMGGFEINRWVKIKAAPTKTNSSQNLAVLYIDINTQLEVPYKFDVDSLKLFLGQSSKLVNDSTTNHLKIWESK